MSKPSYSRIAIALLCGCLIQAATGAQLVRVGIYQNEPKIFLDEDGKPAGFFVDIIDAIAKSEGWQLRYVSCAWHHCLDMLEQGDIDVMPDVAYTPERAARFDFSHEVVLSSWSLLFKRAGDDVDSILDLDGKRIAVLNNSIQFHAFRERTRLFNVFPVFVAVDSFDAAFTLLQRKQVDYVLANRFYGAMHMARYGAEETNILIKPSALQFAFTKGAHDLLIQAIDRDLQQLKHDKHSIYYVSLARWLAPLDKRHVPSWAYWAVLIGALALVVLTVMVGILRYLIKLRTRQINREKQHYFHLSRHDPLTDLPNRLFFFDRLEQTMKDSDHCRGRLHVFFIDLNQFKHINESVGHGIGDSILRTVAGRLREVAGDGSLLAHLGGDEFAVLGEPCREAFDAELMARQLIAALDRPVVAAGQQFYLSMSIGICVYPQDGRSAQEIIKNADTALFHAKNKGRNCFEFYRAEMSDQAIRRVALESELKEALAREQFILHYQPQMDLLSGTVVGLEALVRWQHPDKGLIPPNHFIPVAEDAGMISDLGEWVFRRACAQMVEWHQAGIDLPHIAINVSPKQFHDESFYARVSRIIEETGCHPEWVEIEITESTILDRNPENLHTLKKLRALGFGMAIDDFGTGHSSLSRLKHLPVTKLKIDISFIRGLPDDPSDMALVRAIIALGDGLGLTVLAEGVEREDQRNFLRDAGCTQAQGYLYSLPVDAEEITHMLAVSA